MDHIPRLFRNLCPAPCLACKRHRALARFPLPGLCGVCLDSLRPLDPGQRCRTCLLPMAPERADPLRRLTCAGCRESPPPFSSCWSLWPYQDAVRQAMLCAKFARLPALLQQLFEEGRRLTGLPSLGPDSLVSWVPAEPLRRLQRGYHGPALLAELTARALGVHRLGLLFRPPFNPPLKGLNRTQRRRRANRSYRLMPLLSRAAQGRKILLVDDLFTTGATLAACSRLLLRAGAQRVDTLTLAWDPLQRPKTLKIGPEGGAGVIIPPSKTKGCSHERKSRQEPVG